MGRKRRESDDDVPPAPINAGTIREARELFGYLAPYRLKFGLALAALFISSLFGLFFPLATGTLIDKTLGGTPTDVDRTALLLMALLAGQAVFSFVQSAWFMEVGERGLTDLRRDAYARLIRLPMAFFSSRRVGELTSRIAADLTQIRDTLIATLPQFLRQLVLLVGGVTLILATSGRLALVMLSSFPLLIGVAIVFGRWLRKVAREAQDQLADSNVVVEETLQGVATVKAFTNEAYEEGRYRAGLMEFLTTAIREARLRGAFVAFIIFALFGSVVLVLWYGARMVRAGELSAGELTQFLLYTMYVGGAIGEFAHVYSQVQRALGATQRVREILKEVPEDVTPLRITAPPRRRGTEAPERIVVPKSPLLPIYWLSEGGNPGVLVELHDIHFSYPSRKEVPVLRGLNLRAEPGQRVALVGPSGAGKSTVVSLLLRFYDPDAGRILFDGRDVRDLPLGELRRRAAVVPQDVLLFGGTIADNIAYGRPGALPSEVEEAARRAHAHEFISGFPDGYATAVGERGVQLSGGQRQRVAIARAILRDPELLILDEATSSLDSESESLVQAALEELMPGRTSVIIAHRLATVRRADRIFVLDGGRVAEAGTHEELLAREGGMYRTLSELQMQ